MNAYPVPPVIRPRTTHLWIWIVLAMLVFMPAMIVVGVTSYFRLSSDTKALRNGLIRSSGVEWRQRIALNAGGLTFGAVRRGLSFFPLDTKARAALETVRCAEVGIYELASDAAAPDSATMLTSADKVMNGRGWDRVVGVIDSDDLVAVYISEKTKSARRIECCVMVCDGRQMVLVSAQANLQPLLQMALEETTKRHKAKFLPRS
jgi:hypothetical protein